VRPERGDEVLGLDARLLGGCVQVGVPVVPELDDVEEDLEDGLLLVVAPGVPMAMNGSPSFSTMLGVNV